MDGRIKFVRIVVSIAFVIVSSSCIAGVFDSIGRALNGTSTLRISVVDGQGRPVPYATLWLMYVYKDSQERSVGDMERLLDRYGRDYDLIPAGSLRPIDAIHVLNTSATGVREDVIEKPNFGGVPDLHVIVGGLRRGYRPTAGSVVVSVESTQEFVIALEEDNGDTVNPSLVEIDHIRGEANNVSLTSDVASGIAMLDSLATRLRTLAEALEQNGKNDSAAIAYFTLAHFPSIDRTRLDGQIVVTGFTRGYDPKSTTRKSDMQTALSLGHQVPLLRFDSIAERLSEKGGRIWADASKNDVRRQFIVDTEAALKQAGGRVLPSTLLLLSRAYSAQGEHHEACRVMQELYRFEPRTYTLKNWPDIFMTVVSNATRPYVPNPIPGFVCGMPDQFERSEVLGSN